MPAYAPHTTTGPPGPAHQHRRSSRRRTRRHRYGECHAVGALPPASGPTCAPPIMSPPDAPPIMSPSDAPPITSPPGPVAVQARTHPVADASSEALVRAAAGSRPLT